MRCREHGLALVTVLFFLAILLVLALMLSDKVLRATRSAARAATRDQALQAAAAGIEWTRHQLAASYRTSSGWATMLAGAVDGTRYPERPVFTTSVGQVAVDIFLRDNPDGDADPHRDNDLKVFVLARARTADGGDVLVESLCGFAPETSYRQAGEDPQRSGQAAFVGPAEPWAVPLATFQLHE
jgi:Tfp pilus assembly protein PilV